MNVDINERKVSITFNAEDIEDLKCHAVTSSILYQRLRAKLSHPKFIDYRNYRELAINEICAKLSLPIIMEDDKPKLSFLYFRILDESKAWMEKLFSLEFEDLKCPKIISFIYHTTTTNFWSLRQLESVAVIEN